jgi:hypothetical protein
MERCTIIVDARDRFSTTTRCLETLIANTPQPYDLIVVLGGAPEHLKKAWTARFGDRARFLFRPDFLNQPQARNLGLRAAATRLAVVMDNDNFVRPGWLEALVRCQQQTNAVLVVPIVLETPRRIHAAGNDLHITYENGCAYGEKHLRYHRLTLTERCNMKRQRIDYAEMHCQLVEVEPTLRLGAYDERIIEVGEIDQGLTYQQAGCSLWCEPAAVVHYALGCPIAVEDIRLFAWRWNIRRVGEGYAYFQQKRNFDMSEHGRMRGWLVGYNSQLGLLPRFFPSALSLRVDGWVGRARARLLDLCRIPRDRFRVYKKRRLGYYEWPT